MYATSHLYSLPSDSDSTKKSRSSHLDRDQTALNDRQPKWFRGFRGLKNAACWDQTTELALGDTRNITYISILIPRGIFRCQVSLGGWAGIILKNYCFSKSDSSKANTSNYTQCIKCPHCTWRDTVLYFSDKQMMHVICVDLSEDIRLCEEKLLFLFYIKENSNNQSWGRTMYFYSCVRVYAWVEVHCPASILIWFTPRGNWILSVHIPACFWKVLRNMNSLNETIDSTGTFETAEQQRTL